MKKISAYLFAIGCILTTPTYAQIGGFLKDLKDVADKVKQQSQQTQQAQQLPQTQAAPATQPDQRIQNAQSSQTASTTNKDGSINLSKTDFKKDWCGSIDKQTVSPFDFRNVKSGDLCAQPDEVIDRFFSGGFRTIDPKFPRVLQLNDDDLAVKSKGIEIYTGELLVYPSQKKMYLTYFKAAICATDSSQSLSEGNNFRAALQAKYGAVSKSTSSYDILSIKYEAQKKQAENQRNSAVTVKEAKSARDYQATLNALSSQMNNPALKNEIAELSWNYVGEYKRADNLPGVIVFQSNINSFERSICQNFNNQFTIIINATAGMLKKVDEIVKAGNKLEEDRKNNIEAPKL